MRQRAGLLVVVGLLGGVLPAAAQVSTQHQGCMQAFNNGLRQVAKAQGRVVSKCLRSFASGRLTTTVEACLLGDPGGGVARAQLKADAAVASACAQGTPAFGVSPLPAAIAAAALGEVALLQAAMGADLDGALIPTATAASCQARVTDAVLKCADARRKAFLKCQKAGLRSGTIADAASLAATCLGAGDATQPDPGGRLAKLCGTNVVKAVQQRCGGTTLVDAFPRCGATDASGVGACLQRTSACRLCALVNETNLVARDCDRMDDGNGANGTCGAECADGVLQDEEGCDDGGTAGGDGCSATCRTEPGWTCSGSPSVCTPLCGNGAIDTGESCDDGDTASGDGCSATCAVEAGYACTGTPSTCTRNCGNGVVTPGQGEACDDGDGTGGDGCSATCGVEPGWVCTGQPSVCTFVCGNGSFQAGETCDDGDATPGDGCNATCRIEPGWMCSGAPSLCTPVCGDGLLRGGETCDDGNTAPGDGCSFGCQAETGFSCTAEPSNCTAICGDGFIRGDETCDDADGQNGDGCSGTLCRTEVGWSCLGQPSVCIFNCGNGIVDAGEDCDDGDQTPGDGCGATCRGEDGWACAGTPSVCLLSCGNGVLDGGETCDDGNALRGDGCSGSCRTEPGWRCGTVGTACVPYEIVIDAPAHGIFTTAASVVVAGRYTTLLPGEATVLVNGVPASSVNPLTRTFSHTVALDQDAVLNPIRVTLVNNVTGDDIHERIVIVAGDAVADGALAPEAVAMRVNDSGLDAIEPLVGALAGSQLDLGTLLPPGTVLADQCFINVIGCWGSAQVKIGSPAPSYSTLGLTLDAKTNVVGANITVSNLRVDVDIDGSGLVPDCSLRLTAAAMPLTGDYALSPEPTNPSSVNVDLSGNINVGFVGFNHGFTSGLCNAPIIGDIIQSFLPDIQEFATNGIRGFLADPDGAGPQDSPIADAVEATLAGVSISGAVGSGLGLTIDAPLFDVTEDPVGITLGADSKFTVSVGNGPGQCLPPPGAPDLLASYSKPSAFPVFGANAPVTGSPYGLGIAISATGFNQLLRGQTECGLLRTSIDTIDIDGAGGAPPLPITSTLLALLASEFSVLPPNTPLRVDIAPSMAPLVTGEPGPNGELTELRIAHVLVEIVEPGPETVWLGGAFDAQLGMSLAFLPDGSGLSVTLSEPSAADTAMAITYNPLGANEAELETVLPGLIRPLIPDLASALSGFPLPQFFGLQLGGVEVSRAGEFLSLYANLTPVP